MPFDLTIVNQLSPPLTNTLIVSGSALFGALVGGSITYFVAYKRQKYELRRDAYLAFIDLRIKGSHPSPVGWTKDPFFSRELFLAKYKIDLIGCNQIKELSTKMILALYPDAPIIDDEYKPTATLTEGEKAKMMLDTTGRWNTFKNICDKELKPAIQKELESWWPFDPLHSGG
ncbi:MAG: hypothetical protein PHY05_05595 [Methanothrix sp.]|nr:hypothetical protein [Methanothrix sp.]